MHFYPKIEAMRYTETLPAYVTDNKNVKSSRELSCDAYTEISGNVEYFNHPMSNVTNSMLGWRNSTRALKYGKYVIGKKVFIHWVHFITFNV